MKDKDKWAERLNKKMEGYSESLPDGLWERLEMELPPPHQVVPMWRTRRFAIVAAAALIVMVSGLAVWLAGFWAEDTVYPDAAMARKEFSPFLPDVQPSSSTQAFPLVKARPQAPLTASVVTVQVAERPVKLMSLDAEPETMKTAAREEEPQEEEYVSAHTTSMARADQQMRDRERMRRNRQALSRQIDEEKHSWSIGVHTGNAPISSSGSFNGVRRLGMPAAQLSASDMAIASDDDGRTAYNQVLFNNRDQASKTEVRHRMPITVGASFRWNFASHWALETGLAYTLLSSDLRSGNETYLEEEQKLHYVGVPLKLHRSLFDSRWVSVYASAGGMVEKCVSASRDVVYVNGMSSRETEHNSLHIREWQWSVLAAAGIQVNFTPQIGLYAEPGIAYYFDDGSEIETIRKEHPLNFNLQVGLRFSFP